MTVNSGYPSKAEEIVDNRYVIDRCIPSVAWLSLSHYWISYICLKTMMADFNQITFIPVKNALDS